MEYFVNKGAKLKCPWGSEQSELEVVHIGNPVLLCGSPALLSTSTLSVEKVEGATETYPRQKIAYKVTKYNNKEIKYNS